MDIQTGLICIGLVILSVTILSFISIFDMHKKTYEEAIAEQRKMPENALLLGRLNREKNKDKKQKRQGKKAKEKQSSNKTAGSKENIKIHTSGKKDAVKDAKKETSKTGNKQEKKQEEKKVTPKQDTKKVNQVPPQKEHVNIHVNFVSPEAQILKAPKTNQPSDNEQVKKKKKKAQNENEIKPILVNKKEPVVIAKKPEPTPANHFTKIVPKDELRLKLSNKSEAYQNNSDSENINPNKEKEKKDNSKKKDNNRAKNEKNAKNVTSEVKPLETINNKNVVMNSKNVAATSKNVLVNSKKQNKAEKIKTEQVQKVETNKIPLVKNPVVEQVSVQQKKPVTQQISAKDQKSKKNKKNELTSLQQISEKDGINVQHLIPIIRKADLSRSEVQLLTDVLLNKHADNEVANHSEWMEGKQDPVVKLKKQLAEKEKALAEEQEASLAFQNKLKELRSEYNAERARLGQACRQYEETIMAKQNEISNMHARSRHVHESHVSEKQALTKKLQQLQAQINDDNIVIRKLQEENNQTHNALQKELVSQRQQMEMHMARVKEQHQEAENNLKAQIHAQLQEMEQLTASFNAELQESRRNEEEVRELRDQHIQNQNKIKTLESRASQLKESSSHSQELSRQIEELQRANKELEKRLSGSLKMEEELKFDKIRLQNDIHAYTNKISELQNEFDKVLKEKEKLSAQLISNIEIEVEMEKELMKFKEENQNLLSQVATFTKIEKEAQQLREENENLAAQMTAFTERPAADGRENGDSVYNEDQKKNVNVDFINHENESRNKEILTEKLESQIHQYKILIDSLSTELSDCKSEIVKNNSEIMKYKTEVPRLNEELEQLRNKNNDIHRRNWKAMEALANAEKSLENEQKKTEKLEKEHLTLIKQRELSKEVLQRIFPEITIDEEAYEKWLKKFEEIAKAYLSDLSSQIESLSANSDTSELINELENKNSQLQALVNHYKTIIDDTEGMLSNLQSHIEKEEIRWNQKLEKKDTEITNLKNENDALNERINSQLQVKINELEEELSNVRKELERTRQVIIELEEDIKKDKDIIQKLSGERDSLNSKLNAELEKIKELNKEVVKLKSTLKIGQASYEEEHKKRVELEEELKLLSNRINHADSPHNVVAGVSATDEKPKSRKSKWPIAGWFATRLKKKKSIKKRPEGQ